MRSAHAVELLHRICVPCQASEPIHAEDVLKYWFTRSRSAGDHAILGDARPGILPD